MTVLLEVRDLRTLFAVEGGGEFAAVDGVGFTLDAGRTLGIVGESGCGKSVTALSIMGLVAQPPGRIGGGSIAFDGVDLLQLSPSAMRELRGDRISMIFQEPMTSLNPAFTIGDQIVEGIVRHRPASAPSAKALALEMLRRVHIPSPEERFDDYPHRLSGGMRQRVMIAMALACKPALLIADEPTTALDVTVQAQVLDLLLRLQQERGMALLLITHDLAVVAETAQRVIVMYAGEQVETGPVPQIFDTPQHPYTKALLDALPEHNVDRARLKAIPGVVPGQYDRPAGCLLAPRCDFALARCWVDRPPLAGPAARKVRCHFALDAAGRPTHGWAEEAAATRAMAGSR
jgi:dipeptide transport system ATP-binding protein